MQASATGVSSLVTSRTNGVIAASASIAAAPPSFRNIFRQARMRVPWPRSLIPPWPDCLPMSTVLSAIPAASLSASGIRLAGFSRAAIIAAAARSLRPSASRRRRERILAALLDGGEPVSIAAGLRVGIGSVRRAWQSLSPADRDRVRRARAERRERERAALAARLLADYRAGSPITALCRRYRVSAVRIAAAVPAAERAKRPITDAERSLIRQLYGEGVAIQAIAARLHRAPCTVSEVLPAADRRPARHPSVLALDKVATPELLAEVARRYDAGTSARQIVKDMPDVTLALWERAVPRDRRRVRSRPLTSDLRSAIVRRSRAGASVASLMVEFSLTRSRIRAVLQGG